MTRDTAAGEVLATVTRMIERVVGEDALMLEGPIGLDTAFDADLELESIEIVALAEEVQAHYGHGVDFAGWISDMELDAIIALTVGDLVRFIVSCTSTPEA